MYEIIVYLLVVKISIIFWFVLDVFGFLFKLLVNVEFVWEIGFVFGGVY